MTVNARARSAAANSVLCSKQQPPPALKNLAWIESTSRRIVLRRLDLEVVERDRRQMGDVEATKCFQRRRKWRHKPEPSKIFVESHRRTCIQRDGPSPGDSFRQFTLSPWPRLRAI